jgi:hypothetical protein
MKSVKLFFLLCSVCVAFGSVKAQGVSVSAGADVVSSYIWRGSYVGPASAQPSISLSAGGLDLGIWGHRVLKEPGGNSTSMPHIQ